MTEQKRPVFAVDIDNVLAYAEREVQRIYKELTNQPWPRDFYASAGGLNSSRIDRDLIEYIFDYFHDTSIPMLSVMPGARIALEILSYRYRIIIITARRPSSRQQTVTWLETHRIPYDELYLTDEKALVSEEITLAIDDHPEHALGYSQEGIPVFLMDQPWNQGVELPLVTRVTGWDALVHHLNTGPTLPWPNKIPERPPWQEMFRSLSTSPLMH
jgi:5'(3')-deoxyribonucleotidase